MSLISSILKSDIVKALEEQFISQAEPALQQAFLAEVSALVEKIGNFLTGKLTPEIDNEEK